MRSHGKGEACYRGGRTTEGPCELCYAVKAEHRKRWKLQNPTKVTDSARQYRINHRAEGLIKGRARAAKWREHNPDKKREYQREWNRSHLAKSRGRVKQWRAENPEKRKDLRMRVSARRRASIRGVPSGPYTRREVYIRDGQVCYLCGLHIELKDLQIDHRVPISKGGSDTMDNVAATHSVCNLRKGAKAA